MAELLDSVRKRAKVNYEWDLELRNLVHKVAIAEWDVGSEINYVTTLLNVGSVEAMEVASRISDSFNKLESLLRILRSAHREYEDKIIRNTMGEKEEMDLTKGEVNNLMK